LKVGTGVQRKLWRMKEREGRHWRWRIKIKNQSKPRRKTGKVGKAKKENRM
jgi:hypothetical protein